MTHTNASEAIDAAIKGVDEAIEQARTALTAGPTAQQVAGLTEVLTALDAIRTQLQSLSGRSLGVIGGRVMIIEGLSGSKTSLDVLKIDFDTAGLFEPAGKVLNLRNRGADVVLDIRGDNTTIEPDLDPDKLTGRS